MVSEKRVLFPPVKNRVTLGFIGKPTLIDAIAVVSQLNDAHLERSGDDVRIVIDGSEN